MSLTTVVIEGGRLANIAEFLELSLHHQRRWSDHQDLASSHRSLSSRRAEMPSDKGCAFAAHLVVVSADPNQVSAGVQLAELGARDAVHGPFGVGDRHGCIGPIMQNERRTFDGVGREPRLARPIGPVILNPVRPLATADH